jgi:hypothetical protein
MPIFSLSFDIGVGSVGVDAVVNAKNALALVSACERIGADLFGFGYSGVAAEDDEKVHHEGAGGDGMDEGAHEHIEKRRRRSTVHTGQLSLMCPCLTAAQLLAAAQDVVGAVTL